MSFWVYNKRDKTICLFHNEWENTDGTPNENLVKKHLTDKESIEFLNKHPDQAPQKYKQ